MSSKHTFRAVKQFPNRGGETEVFEVLVTIDFDELINAMGRRAKVHGNLTSRTMHGAITLKLKKTK